MPLDIVAVATERTQPPRLCEVRFTAAPNGEIHQYIDGDLRAMVPPEGWDDLVAAWPAAQPMIDALRN